MMTGYTALREGAALLDLTGRGEILARGRDRARLLHSLTTNEVKKLTPRNGCYAFLLSPQGRIQADLNLFAFDDHFLIDTEPELREKLPAHIRKYIVADQVELEDATGRLAAIGIEGPGAAALLTGLGAGVPAAPFDHTEWDGATVAAVTVTGQPGFRLFVDAARKAEVLSRLEAASAIAATPEEARTVRLENARPRYGDDIGENTLPQETGAMHAVSFTKGCYLGQEIVERIRARGHVNRKLVKLAVDGAEPLAAGTKLDGDAGEVTSSVYSPAEGAVIALAYLRVAQAEPGTRLVAGGRAVTVAT